MNKNLREILERNVRENTVSLIAARPEMGKTTLVLQALCELARLRNGRALIVSLEMTAEKIYDRLEMMQYSCKDVVVIEGYMGIYRRG